MRIAASIMLVLYMVLLFQPLFGSPRVEKKPVASSCCSKSKCQKPSPESEKKDCENNRCNPFMGCVSGNWFEVSISNIAITSPIVPEVKSFLFNDNRILHNISECWHPPESGIFS